MSIVAYEGPAGSGKGYQLDKLKGLSNFGGREDVVFLERPKLPRDLGPQVGAWSSGYLEYMAILAATMMRDKHFYVDRFLLSRWVYKAIEEDGRLDPYMEDNVAESWYEMIGTAQGEAHRRIGGILWLAPEAQVFVLLPSLGVLMANRSHAHMTQGRTYPFSPVQELSLYTQAALRLKAANIRGLNVEIVEL